jgi:hypothetical protein
MFDLLLEFRGICATMFRRVFLVQHVVVHPLPFSLERIPIWHAVHRVTNERKKLPLGTLLRE